MQRERANLGRNDKAVFLELADNIKKAKRDERQNGIADDLARMREQLQKQKKNKNT